MVFRLDENLIIIYELKSLKDYSYIYIYTFIQNNLTLSCDDFFA